MGKAQEKSLETVMDIASTQLFNATAPNAPPANSSGVQSRDQERLNKLLADRLEREEIERVEKEEMERLARIQGALAMQHRRDRELAEQEACSHMKPWGGPSVGGQKDHQGHIHFICLFCAKVWIDNELPQRLRISMDRVGGPS
jgi:hypothetical protein